MLQFFLEILKTYELCLGQDVNFDKSTVFFSRNTTEEDKDGIIAEIGQIQRTNLGLYLCLPAVVGRSKKKVLNFIKERVETKIMGMKKYFFKSSKQNCAFCHSFVCFVMFLISR